MRRRSRVIGTRRSPVSLCSWASSACATGSAAGGALGAALSSAGLRYVSTSDLVRRPSFPLAGTACGSIACSATSLRTAGLSLVISFLLVGLLLLALLLWGLGAAGSWLGAVGSGVAAGGGGWSATALRTLVSMTARVSWLTAVWPSCLRSSLRTPSAGALTSSVTLSVSRSQSGSPRVTRSPTRLRHGSSVASAIDSASWGTLTSTSTVRPFFALGGHLPGQGHAIEPERLVH